LIQRGTSVDAKDRYGQSALILAASLGHTEAVKLLLEANADWTVKDSK
jgi:ankyrin repeat protein